MEGGGSAKARLEQFCRSFCQRPMTPEDIIYSSSQFGEQFQSIVKLACLGGQEYAGKLTAHVMEAEQEAAQQALASYASEVEAMGASAEAAAAAPKRKAAEAGFTSDDFQEKRARVAASDSPSFTPKVKLNAMCMRIAKRFLSSGDSIFTCMSVPGGIQATVQLPCLPGDWKDRVWAGEVSENRQRAEQSAAEIAMGQITGDPEMSQQAESPAFGTGAGLGGWNGGSDGCGAGKGGGSFGVEAWLERTASPGRYGGPGKGGGRLASQQSGNLFPEGGNKGTWGSEKADGGKGRGKAEPSGAPGWSWSKPAWRSGGSNNSWGSSWGKKKHQPRQRISPVPIMGDVLEWKGSYAWVRPQTPIEHPEAKGHGGRVYVHKKDLSPGLTELVPGQTVSFHVYEDGSGLGGEEVTLA